VTDDVRNAARRVPIAAWVAVSSSPTIRTASSRCAAIPTIPPTSASSARRGARCI
jgi:hypothetical protein